MSAYLRHTALVLLAFVALCALHGQTAADTQQAGFVGKIYFLRPMCAGSLIRFNAAGEVEGTCERLPFTISLFQIDHVKISNGRLELRAHRLGLIFKDNKPQMMNLSGLPVRDINADIAVQIQAPTLPVPDSVLRRIFATSYDELYSDVPDFWRPFFRAHLLPASFVDPFPSPGDAPVDKIDVKAGILPPKMKKQVDADFSPYARAASYTSECLVQMVLDTNGIPTRLAIVKAAGLGQDEEAIRAVSQYRFAPVLKNGQPIAVALKIATTTAIR